MKLYILIGFLIVILTFTIYFLFIKKNETFVSEQEAPFKFYNNSVLGNESIVGIEISKYGNYITLIQSNEYINVSSDGGNTFVQKESLFNNQSGKKNWSSISMSNDGQYQIVCDKDVDGSLWYSKDFGSNWNPIGALNNSQDKKGWVYACISGSGEKIFAVTSYNNISKEQGKLYEIVLSNYEPLNPTYKILSNDPLLSREWKYIKTGFNGNAVTACTSNLVYYLTRNTLNDFWDFTELSTDELSTYELKESIEEDPDIRTNYSKFDLNIVGCSMSGIEIGDSKTIYIVENNSESIGEDTQLGLCINLTKNQNIIINKDYFPKRKDEYTGIAMSHFGSLATCSFNGVSHILGKVFSVLNADNTKQAAELNDCQTPIIEGYNFTAVAISRDQDNINNDGKYIVLGSSLGDLLISKNYGETWEMITK